MDLYVGYDKRTLAESSRALTTFQTPYGAMRLTTLPMGWTNSVPIFHDDVTHILQPEIPHVTQPYINNVPVKGPASVAMAIADVFSKNGYTVSNKIAKILRIFDGLETLKSQWVISLH